MNVTEIIVVTIILGIIVGVIGNYAFRILTTKKDRKKFKDFLNWIGAGLRKNMLHKKKIRKLLPYQREVLKYVADRKQIIYSELNSEMISHHEHSPENLSKAIDVLEKKDLLYIRKSKDGDDFNDLIIINENVKRKIK